MKTKRIEFLPPPEVTEQMGSASSGTRLELMTRYVVKENGHWCIVSIEGVPMPGFDADGNPVNNDKSEHMDMNAGERMAGKMKSAMAGAGTEGY